MSDTGRPMVVTETEIVTEPCPKCDGTGRRVPIPGLNDTCPACDGTGWRETKRITRERREDYR